MTIGLVTLKGPGIPRRGIPGSSLVQVCQPTAWVFTRCIKALDKDPPTHLVLSHDACEDILGCIRGVFRERKYFMSWVIIIIVILALLAVVGGGRRRGGWGGPRAAGFDLIELLIIIIIVVLAIYLLLGLL